MKTRVSWTLMRVTGLTAAVHTGGRASAFMFQGVDGLPFWAQARPELPGSTSTRIDAVRTTPFVLDIVRFISTLSPLSPRDSSVLSIAMARGSRRARRRPSPVGAGLHKAHRGPTLERSNGTKPANASCDAALSWKSPPAGLAR